MTKAAQAHTPAQNTKVELLAEAIEDLIAGTVAKMGAQDKGERKPSEMLNDYVTDARAKLRDALMGFLVPALHLIEDGPRQAYTADVALSDRVTCAACNRHMCCSDRTCPDWHAAVRKTIGGGDAA